MSGSSLTCDTISYIYVTYGPSFKPKGWALGFFVSDTWKATSKLNVTLGLRWDRYEPSFEKDNRTSFFDPYVPNPGPGGLPGRPELPAFRCQPRALRPAVQPRGRAPVQRKPLRRPGLRGQQGNSAAFPGQPAQRY